MKAPNRAPWLPLTELEAILHEVTEMLGAVPRPSVAPLDGRIVQCRVAIAACKRQEFSPPLLRALSAKVLELETDALVLRRTLRIPKSVRVTPEAQRRDKRSRDKRSGGGRRR